VIVLVELEGVNCCLIVDTDEHSRAWQGGGEKCGDCFLYGMQLGIEDLSPVAKVTLTFR
jgi:hypothetical protein